MIEESKGENKKPRVQIKKSNGVLKNLFLNHKIEVEVEEEEDMHTPAMIKGKVKLNPKELCKERIIMIYEKVLYKAGQEPAKELFETYFSIPHQEISIEELEMRVAEKQAKKDKSKVPILHPVGQPEKSRIGGRGTLCYENFFFIMKI